MKISTPKLPFIPLLAALFCLNFSAPSNARADEITVSAAASLRDVMGALATDFARSSAQNAGTKVRFNFGSSGALQKQIEAGAPVDLFVAAASKNVAALAQSGDIEGASRRVLARGELVLIAPRGSKLRSFSELRGANIGSIAVGGAGVPAGDYARQTFAFLGLKTVVAPKLVVAKDVRAVLSIVAGGNADAGVVYRTDALTSPAVRIVAVAPLSSHDAVIYPMALVKNAPNRVSAARFWKFLQSQSAKNTLKRFGFRA